MIGMELGVSVASVVLRGEPTGCPKGFYSDVVATAKHALTAGEILDGEGGHCVWGQQMPAADSIERGALPLGLAADIKMRCNVAAGSTLCWADVEFDDNDTAVRARQEMEVAFSDRL
jgi:predicted homoserine dehydrogenase-like protein